MSRILANAFACLTRRPGATLWDVKRLLEDQEFRKEIAASVPMPVRRALYPPTSSFSIRRALAEGRIPDGRKNPLPRLGGIVGGAAP